MELLIEILPSVEDRSFLRSQLDMKLLGWTVMYLCLCLDGVNCSLASDGSTKDLSHKKHGEDKGN